MEDCRLRPWRRTMRRDASSPPLPQHPSPLDVLELNRRSGSCRRRRQVTLALYLLATGTHKALLRLLISRRLSESPVHRRGTSATPLWPSARNGPIIRLANKNPLPDLKMPDRNPQHSFMVMTQGE